MGTVIQQSWTYAKEVGKISRCDRSAHVSISQFCIAVKLGEVGTSAREMSIEILGMARKKLRRVLFRKKEIFWPETGEKRNIKATSFFRGPAHFGWEFPIRFTSFFRKSLRLTKNKSATWSAIGVCYACMGALDQAMNALNEALALNPHDEVDFDLFFIDAFFR